jgi:hypothetical protein
VVCGVWTVGRLCSLFVSIAEVGKQRAVLAILGEQPRATVEGLAPHCESITRSERALEAGPRRQSPGYGGGRPPRERKGRTC